MTERKVRFGFRYRSARKKLNGNFKSSDIVDANEATFQNGNSPQTRMIISINNAIARG
jgi:hypothetical protein